MPIRTTGAKGAYTGDDIYSGAPIVTNSLTLPLIENSALATDENGLVYGVTGAPGDVMRLSGTGTGELDAVIYTGSLYITVGGTGYIYTSPDGETNWTQRTSPVVTQLFSLAWSGSLAVATGLSGVILTSPDGITWTARTSGVAVALASVTWNGAVFIAVGSSQTVLTSPDGITWTARTFGATTAIRGVASNASLAVAVCASGLIRTSTNNGVTWTARTSGVATTLWKVAVNAGGTLWTAVGSSGVILTSPDGTTWTARVSGAGTTTLENVAFGNSLWIAVGDGGFITTSPDGTTWTQRTSGTIENLFGIVYGAKWLCVGNAIKLTSTDGTTWTPVSQLTWIASTPTGTGQIVTASGAAVLNDLRTFTTPIRESTILSAPAIATNASGDHVPAATTGAGSTIMLSDSPTTTGTMAAAAVVASGLITANASIFSKVSSGTGIGPAFYSQNLTNAAEFNLNYAGSSSGVSTWTNGSVIAEQIPVSTGYAIWSSFMHGHKFQTGNRVDRVLIEDTGMTVIGSMAATSFTAGALPGVSGTFLSADAKTITVTNGIITGIV